jgi:hypothetical protein
MKNVPEPDWETIEAVAITLATHGCFPVKICRVTDHTHPKDDSPCRTPGKRPWEEAWQKGTREKNLAQLDAWKTMGFGVGNVMTGDTIGMDEDVVEGLTKWFEEQGEGVPPTLGDEVPLTGKRHIVVKRHPNVSGKLVSKFSLKDGTVIGEIARDGARQFVSPGCVWRKGDDYDVRRWNGVSVVVTLSETATRALLEPEFGGQQAGRPERSDGEWQWDEGMGSRHDLIVKEARRMAGTVRDEALLYQVMLDWASRHGLIGQRPDTGRVVHDAEVRDAVTSAIRKYDEDPAPITLLFPTAEAHKRQQQEQAQQATLETLYSLPYGTPPPPLVRDMFIAAEGWTVLYANGGSGKGILALWMVHEFMLANHEARVAVLDYEAHQWEWGNRARAMGWTDDELKRVLYVNPYDPVWPKGHTLDGLAPQMAPLTKRLDIGLYVVDSFATSVKPGAEMGGADAAVGFFKAGAQLGAPGLVLAHTAATTERFPAKPFGSSHIHNQARETWAQAKTDVIEMGPKKGLFGVTSTVMQVELANKKRSVGAQPLGRQGFDIEFTSLGGIEVRWNGAQGASVSQMVVDALATARRGMTVKALRDAIIEDTGVEVSRNTLEHTVRSMADRGEVDVLGDSRPKTYGLPRVAADED